MAAVGGILLAFSTRGVGITKVDGVFAVGNGGVLDAVRSGIATRCRKALRGTVLGPVVGMYVPGYIGYPIRLGAVVDRSPLNFANAFRGSNPARISFFLFPRIFEHL